MTSKIYRSESSPVKSKVIEITDFLSSKKTNLRKVKNTELHSKESPLTRKRKKILNEIYETEKTYQHHLMLLISLFLEPVKVSVVLPPKVIDGIFSNVEAIQQVSSHLIELMEDVGIVHALLQLAPYMKLYALYANNYNNAMKLLEEWLKKSADFSRLIKFQECREEMQCLKLSALLITPIQRVPRYQLLLENLLEKTFEDDPDYKNLKDASKEIINVANHINECVRQQENFHKMLSIQNSFTGTNVPKILAPGRRFIQEGTVTKISERGGAKERTLFLFNDILIIAKKETYCTFQCCGLLPLVNCIVEQVMGSSRGNGLFKVLCGNENLLLCAKNDSFTWVDDIKKTISDLHSNLASFRRGENPHNIVVPSEDDIPVFKKPSTPFKILQRQLTLSTKESKTNNPVDMLDMTRRSVKHRKDLVPKRLGSLINVNTNRHSAALLDSNRNSLVLNARTQPNRLSICSDMFHQVTSSTIHNGDSLMTSQLEDEVFRDTRPVTHNWTVTEKKPIDTRQCPQKRKAPTTASKVGCGSRKSKHIRRESYSPYTIKERRNKLSTESNPKNENVGDDNKGKVEPIGNIVNTENAANTEKSVFGSCTIM